MLKNRRTFKRLVDESDTYRRVDPAEVADALGAESVASRRSGGSPFSVQALRTRLMTDLVSCGGRPGRREAAIRKIPLTDTEWELLDDIAALIRSKGINTTPGQVAGVLLNQSMAEVLLRLDHERSTEEGPQLERNNLTDAEIEQTIEETLAAAASAEVHLGQLKPVAIELLRRMRAKQKQATNEE